MYSSVNSLRATWSFLWVYPGIRRVLEQKITRADLLEVRTVEARRKPRRFAIGNFAEIADAMRAKDRLFVGDSTNLEALVLGALEDLHQMKTSERFRCILAGYDDIRECLVAASVDDAPTSSSSRTHAPPGCMSLKRDRL